MASTRQLKNKIGTVRNIKQITKAMQMVAATKMRKAQEVALRARPYAKKSFALLLHLLQYAQGEGFLTLYIKTGADKGRAGIVPVQARVNSLSQTEKVALVVVTSDKGLAGSFNSAVLRVASQWKQEQENGRGPTLTVDIVAVGRKGRDFFKKRGAVIAAEFFQYSDIFTLSDIAPLMDWILKVYEEGRYGKIVFCSTQFVSVLLQKPAIIQILPLEVEELKNIIEGIIPKNGKYAEILKTEEKEESLGTISYLLEPSPKDIFEQVVRDFIRVAILHLMFESNASEHSARMIAMKNATENAEELVGVLNVQWNKARQAAITQELAEVTTAKEALTAE